MAEFVSSRDTVLLVGGKFSTISLISRGYKCCELKAEIMA